MKANFLAELIGTIHEEVNSAIKQIETKSYDLPDEVSHLQVYPFINDIQIEFPLELTLFEIDYNDLKVDESKIRLGNEIKLEKGNIYQKIKVSTPSKNSEDISKKMDLGRISIKFRVGNK